MTKAKTIADTAPEELAGYRFKTKASLDEALTHPSLSGSYNYQRLEFLGDRVLGLVISTWLLEEYPRDAEGSLNRKFTSLVRRETLAEMTDKLDLIRHLKLTPGAEAEGTREKEAIMADVCESVIGAIYLDGGFAEADKFIRRHWASLIGAGVKAHKDHKTQLQEWCQAKAVSLPKYVVTDRQGPDHNPVFTIEAVVEEIGSASATGSAKRLAEQAAAEKLFLKLSGAKGGK